MKREARKHLCSGLLATAALSVTVLLAAQGKQTFTGKITDSECPTGDHSAMQMGPTDAECTIACVEVHGATFVLYDGKHSYQLSDQQTPRKFAGQKVTVTGTLDSKTSTIHVDSIVAAK
jgi:cytochrome c-type biogenesis protein CcmE